MPRFSLRMLMVVMLLGGPALAVAITFALSPKVEVLDNSVNPTTTEVGPAAIQVQLEDFGERVPPRQKRTFPWIFD